MGDLAALAGVSKITVSRALADSPLVRPELRQRIQELARTEGYRFNLAARNLRLKRSHSVAVVVAASTRRSMTDAYPLALLGGIAQRMATAGYIVILVPRERASGPEVRGADGVILLGQGAHDDVLHNFDDIGTPLLVWGAVREDMRPGVVVVGSDNLHGGQSAADYLIGQGHRRLIFLGDTDYAELADRFDGFEQTLRGRGAALAAKRACSFTADGGYYAIKSLIEEGAQFDGVFCCCDLVAVGALNALSESGRAVPKDVSVVGYDDSPFAASFTPAISTIRQDWEAGGIMLAEKMLKCIETGQASSEVLRTTLVIRDT